MRHRVRRSWVRRFAGKGLGVAAMPLDAPIASQCVASQLDQGIQLISPTYESQHGILEYILYIAEKLDTSLITDDKG
jgi:hypothetical protein